MIKDYWIEAIQNIKEFESIGVVEDGEIKKVNDELSNIINDQFIQTATEEGIARREKILNLIPFADDTLESRRFRVLSKWGDGLPYTYRSMIERLTQLCGEDGFSVQLNSNEYTMFVRVELTVKRMEDEARNLLRKMAPANLLITVELRYNQHKKLKRYTHRQLKEMRHREMREEVLK
ncbi:putative phage tail protein [Niameybacter massiliensis]|uniref:putative phage tail protein n=1 Tax=Niameybacter massiliensis TaxID=1658108 RepID=UPI0006B56521|nr:putative phage tail protein [Niameybacter massiliensis]